MNYIDLKIRYHARGLHANGFGNPDPPSRCHPPEADKSAALPSIVPPCGIREWHTAYGSGLTVIETHRGKTKFYRCP